MSAVANNATASRLDLKGLIIVQKESAMGVQHAGQRVPPRLGYLEILDLYPL
jgi:hypothetical protein